MIIYLKYKKYIYILFFIILATILILDKNKLNYFANHCELDGANDKVVLSDFCADYLKKNALAGNELELSILISHFIYKNNLINNIEYLKIGVSKGMLYAIEQTLFLCARNFEVQNHISNIEIQRGFALANKKNSNSQLAGRENLEFRWRANEFNPCKP